MLGQEASGEAVERGQRGEVDVGEGYVSTSASHRIGILAGHVLELAAEAVAEFSGRPLSERDGSDPLDGDAFVDH